MAPSVLDRSSDRSFAPLTPRDRALLAAVHDGRCDLAPTGVPDLRVDGRWFCDQPRVYGLVAAGLLTRAPSERSAERTPALLTTSGVAALRAGR